MDRKMVYQECYRVVRELFSGLGERDLLSPCPQCPGWSLRDVLAHHAHVFSERIKGWPEEFAADTVTALIDPNPEIKLKAARRRDEWIERGVESFRTQPFASVLTAWDRAMEQAGDSDWIVADLAVHVGDIEEALDVEGSRESDFVVVALSQYGKQELRKAYKICPEARTLALPWARQELADRFLIKISGSLLMRLAQSLDGLGLETVKLIGSRPKFEGGDAQSPHQVRETVYELLRTLTGRRSRAEAEQALDWGATPEAARQVFAVYGWLDEDSGVALSLP